MWVICVEHWSDLDRKEFSLRNKIDKWWRVIEPIILTNSNKIPINNQ